VRAAIPSMFTGAGSVAEGIPRGPWWPSVTDADYQATVMVPALLAEKLEELGIDFTILYSSLGLGLVTLPDADTRLPAVRGLNAMLADLCKAHAYRLTPAAVIPMHTPEEAIAELCYVRRELGLRATMIPPAVARPLAAYPDLFPRLAHPDRYGIDSAHDYDPVWRAFEELGCAVTPHGAVGLRYLPDGRSSPSNYSYNHALGHGYLMSELCRALVYGGVPSRFPKLSFGFLEGGASWAIAVLGARRALGEALAGAPPLRPAAARPRAARGDPEPARHAVVAAGDDRRPGARPVGSRRIRGLRHHLQGGRPTDLRRPVLLRLRV
jgi:predicted TIM-barrel fold metal-dependent hydrolase